MVKKILRVFCLLAITVSFLAGAAGTANADSWPARNSIVYYASCQVGRGYSQDLDKRLGPDYFDCSGLVYMAYRYAGVTVNNSLLDWVAMPIQQWELLPGDLLYQGYETRAGYQYPTGYHVGLYVGNGEVIHAKGSNYGVVREPFNPASWTWYGRIPASNWPGGENGSDYTAIYSGGLTQTEAYASVYKNASVTIRNLGMLTWHPTGANPVNLAYYWVDNASGAVVRTGPGFGLPQPVPYGDQVVVTGRVLTPSAPGSYTLYFDLVHEGVTFFSGRSVDRLTQGVYAYGDYGVTYGPNAAIPRYLSPEDPNPLI